MSNNLLGLTCSPVYRELQKHGRKSTGVINKASAPTNAINPTGSMGPPQSIPKKGKGVSVVVPMSEDEDGNTQGPPAEADMDVDAEMNDPDDGDINESQGEDGEEGEEEEEEEEELVDQMTVEDEEIRRDTKGLELHEDI